MAVRGAAPGWFAMVMATGIVSAALLQAGSAALSGVLLGVAATALTVLAALSGWRALVFPAALRADLASPDRAFACFAPIAACDVVGARLAAAGHLTAAGALAAAALVLWLAVTWLVPARLAAGLRRPVWPGTTQLAAAPCRRPILRAVGGSWYLWAVSTQSLAIMAALWAGGRSWADRAATVAAAVAWSAGAVLYLAVTALAAARLRLTGLRPQEPTAPFWVAMGAASITVLAAARVLASSASPPVPGGRATGTGLAVAFWIAASCLIPPLAGRSAWRHRRGRNPLRYRPDLWMIVFPAGMYATASMQLAAAAGLPLLHGIGVIAAWIAAAAWALTFVTMIISVPAALAAALATAPAASGRFIS